MTTFEHPAQPSEADYIRTTTQNYVSRSARILGPANVRIKGKTIIQSDVTIHGDRGALVQIGRYSFIDVGSIISPTMIPASSDPTSPLAEKALQLNIGSHTRIGPNCNIQAISVGSYVRIGSNCVLSPRSKVFDCCAIDDDTHLPPDMIVPPFSRVRGNPGRIVGSLPECCGGEFVEISANEFGLFLRGLKVLPP